MAVRVWREWLAVGSVLGAVACSGNTGSRDVDPDVEGNAAASSGGTKSSARPSKGGGQGRPTQPGSAGGAVIGQAGEAASAGGRPGTAGAPVKGGAGGAEDVATIAVGAPGDRTVHESYGTMPLHVVLTAQPTASVEIGLLSSDTEHAVVYPPSLTFTPENWSKTQTAVVVGVRDAVADDGNTVLIQTLPALSADARYDGVDVADFDVFVIDETDAGIVVGPTEGLLTSESGNTATFNIVLTSRPTDTVTIPLSSSDTAEGEVAALVTFEPAEWSMPHPVTVTGIDDALTDGARAFAIVTGPALSTDLHYDGRDPVDVIVTNVDDD